MFHRVKYLGAAAAVLLTLGCVPDGTNPPGSTTTVPSSTTVPTSTTTTTVPTGSDGVLDVGVGGNHECFLADDGWVSCSGANNAGQLGNGTTTDSTVPVAIARGAIPAGVTLTDLGVGYRHNCALGSDNKVYCWGENTKGELGNASTSDSSIPVEAATGALPSGLVIADLVANLHYSCLLSTGGEMYCWGENFRGVFGNGTTNNSFLPTPMVQGARPAGVTMANVYAGASHMCGFGSDGVIYCWGYQGAGRLGDGVTTLTNRTTAGPILAGALPAGQHFTQLAVGERHNCALGSDSKSYCWGDNGTGGLGDSTSTSRSTPVLMLDGAKPAGVGLVGVHAGRSVTCVRAAGGEVYCTGSNGSGELANGTNVSNRVLSLSVRGQILAGVTLDRIVIGPNGAACGIGTDDEAYCWGYGYGTSPKLVNV